MTNSEITLGFLELLYDKKVSMERAEAISSELLAVNELVKQTYLRAENFDLQPCDYTALLFKLRRSNDE